MSKHEWTGQADCATSDPDLWFSPNPVDIEEAKRICSGCPVRQQCAARATEFEGSLSHSYRHGIWAGQDTRERAEGTNGHQRSRRAAELRARILAMPDAEATHVASIAGCTPDHVWRVRRLHAAEQQDMAVAA